MVRHLRDRVIAVCHRDRRLRTYARDAARVFSGITLAMATLPKNSRGAHDLPGAGACADLTETSVTRAYLRRETLGAATVYA